jgi:hypothetical protein
MTDRSIPNYSGAPSIWGLLASFLVALAVYAAAESPLLAAPGASHCCGTQKTDCEGCKAAFGGQRWFLVSNAKYYVCGFINNQSLSCDNGNYNCANNLLCNEYNDAACTVPRGTQVNHTQTVQGCTVPPAAACPPPPPPGGGGGEG